MAILNNNDKYCNWYYEAESIQLLIGRDIINIPSENLNSMNILHNYDENMFPIFQIVLLLNANLYNIIIKNKNIVKIKLRIQKFYVEIGKNNRSMYRDFINDTFDLILDDSIENLDRELQRDTQKNDLKNISTDLSNDIKYQTFVPCEFFLFKNETIESTKKPINAIFSNASPTDVLYFLLKEGNIKNVLMSPSDNIVKYKKIIIPPLKLGEAIKFLDSYYGLYKNGSMIYFDFNKVYILNYIGECTAYEKNEKKETNIIIPSSSSLYSSNNCGVIKSNNLKKNYILGSNMVLNIMNESITNNILNGNDIMVIDNVNGEINITNNENISRGENFINIIKNKVENPFIGETYINLMNSKSITISTIIGNYDIETISPNKKINIIFEDTSLANKYNYNYHISSVSHNFIKDGKLLSLQSTIQFVKVK